MRALFIQFRKSEDGATLVEYGVALILAIILGGGALVTLSGQVGDNMGCAEDAMEQRSSAVALTC